MSNAYGYARMPRIIRKGYKHLTKLQKLLYIYLRDLCGEKGTCYRSLRTLADETDFSIGYLSENIPLLEQSGLIEAKKKKRGEKKWEVWHITIVDIWEQNAQFLKSEKCSPGEQNDVHDMNCSQDEQNQPESVHGMNEDAEKCSHGANKEEKSLNKNPITDREKEEAPVSCTPSQQFIYYCELEPEPTNKTLAEAHCEKLEAAGITTREQFRDLYALAARRVQGKTDETVHLGNMVKCLPLLRKSEQQTQDEWWNQSKRNEPQPAPEMIVEALPLDWQTAELSPDLLDWIIALTQDWHDESNMQANVAILQAIYRQAQRAETEFYDFLTASAKSVGNVPEYERMDHFFEYLCGWLKIAMPYTPAQAVTPIALEAQA